MFQKGQTVTNTRTGATGVIIGAWWNEYAESWRYNVLPQGAKRANWQIWMSSETAAVQSEAALAA